MDLHADFPQMQVVFSVFLRKTHADVGRCRGARGAASQRPATTGPRDSQESVWMCLKMVYTQLVGGLEHVLFSHILGC